MVDLPFSTHFPSFSDEFPRDFGLALPSNNPYEVRVFTFLFMFFEVLSFLSLLLTTWQWIGSRSFRLHKRISTDPKFTPGVSILKPLKGADEHTHACLKSWFTQAYPGKIQILLGVASLDDPACEVVRQLIREFPSMDAQLVHCKESLGVNAKVSSLIQLNRVAEHRFIVVSDADVLAAPDFLSQALIPLQHKDAGLVNCFYRLANPSTPAMYWEAVAINADFWSQVLQGKSLAPIDFALGAVMLTRSEYLKSIGGFEALADYLADDFQLGNRIAHIARKQIALCPVVVDCVSHPMNWCEVWVHQLRWARTIRVCRPLPFAFSILSNATLWPFLWFVFFPTALSGVALGASVIYRMFTAQLLQIRLGRVPGQWKYFWMPPIKDLLGFGIWALALFGNTIVWRGQHYLLQKDGKLVPDPRH